MKATYNLNLNVVSYLKIVQVGLPISTPEICIIDTSIIRTQTRYNNSYDIILKCVYCENVWATDKSYYLYKIVVGYVATPTVKRVLPLIVYQQI